MDMSSNFSIICKIEISIKNPSTILDKHCTQLELGSDAKVNAEFSQ